MPFFDLPVLVRNEERSLDVTAVRILTFAVEDLPVVFVVIQIHGSIEGQQDNLRNLV